jgi:hypothetical protein
MRNVTVSGLVEVGGLLGSLLGVLLLFAVKLQDGLFPVDCTSVSKRTF